MKLSVKNTFILACFLASNPVQAVEKDCIAYHFNSGTCKMEIESLSIDPANKETLLNDEAKICLYDSDYTIDKYEGKDKPKVFRLLTRYHCGSDELKYCNKALLKKNFVKNLKKKDVEQLGWCLELDLTAPLMETDVLRAVPVDQMVLMISGARTSSSEPAAILSKLGSSYVKEHREKLLPAVLNRISVHSTRYNGDPNFMQKLDKDTFKALIAHADDSDALCDQFTTEIIQNLGNKASLLTQACVEKIPATSVCNPTVRSWPSESLKGNSNLHRSCYRYMTAQQIHALGSKTDEGEWQCKHVPISTYLAHNGGQMTSECFLRAVLEKETTEKVKLGSTYNTLNDGIFSRVTDEQLGDLLEIIDPNDFAFIRTEQKRPLFAHADECSSLPAQALAYHSRDLSITNECFWEMSNEPQALAFMNTKVSPNCLDKSDLEIDEWKISGYDHTGFAILNASNRIEQIAKMNADLCSKIDGSDREALGKLDRILNNASEACIKKIDLKIENVGELEPLTNRAIALFITKDLLENLEEDENYDGIQPKVFRVLLDKHDFLKKITLKNFDKFAKKTLKTLTAAEIESLPFLASLDSSQLENLSKKQLVKLSPEAREKISPNLGSKQKQFLEEEVKAAAQRAAYEEAKGAKAAEAAEAEAQPADK